MIPNLSRTVVTEYRPLTETNDSWAYLKVSPMSADVSFLVVLATKSGNHKIRMNGDKDQTIDELRLRAWLGQFFSGNGFELPDGQATIPPQQFHVDFFTLDSLLSDIRGAVSPLPSTTMLGSIQSKRVLVGVCSDAASNVPPQIMAKVLAVMASKDPDVQKVIDDGLGDGDVPGPDVFISYSTADSPIAEELEVGLRNRGYEVFLAHKTISVGLQWEDQVFDAVRSCRVAVLVLSQNSRNSDWVRIEIGALVALGKHVAPGLVGLQPSETPELVRKYQGRPVSSQAEREVFCDEVARLLNES